MTRSRRESLRDIEVCLEANQAKLFHMGIDTPPARSTLADALNLRDWRIYHALALRLVARARVPNSSISRWWLSQAHKRLRRGCTRKMPRCWTLGVVVCRVEAVEHDALIADHATGAVNGVRIAPRRSSRVCNLIAALVERNGAQSNILLVEAGSFYIRDRGYVDYVRLYAMHQAGAFFVTRAKQGMDARRVYSRLHSHQRR